MEEAHFPGKNPILLMENPFSQKEAHFSDPKPISLERSPLPHFQMKAPILS